MKALSYFLLVFSLLLSDCYAQDNDTSRVWRPGFYLSVLGQTVDLTELNRALTQAGIPELTSGLVGTSVGFTNRHRDQNSYGLTKLTYLTSQNDGTDAGSDARIHLWKISFAGHYDLLPNPKWLAYPYLDLGYAFGMLKVSSITNINSFQGSLNNLNSPDEIVKRYSSGMLLNGEIGAGVERRIIFPGSINFIGISVGYEISQQADWRTSNANYFLANSPAFRTNGWVFEFRFRFEFDPTSVTEKMNEPRGLYRLFH